MKQWNKQPHSRCPRCMQQDKDVHHVLKCLASTATTTWNEGLNMIYQWMKKNYSAPTLPEVILHHLTSWRTDTHTNMCNVLRTDNVDLALPHQNSLGWDTFLKDFVPPIWAQIQNDHFLEIKSRRTGTQWCSQLIRKIW